MLKIFKHWFVPHRANAHQPQLLRGSSLIGLALLVLGLQLVYNLAVTGQARVLSYATNISEITLVELTNQARAQAGLPALQTNGTLRQAAQAKAVDMLGRDYWSHLAPDGTEPWQFVSEAGYSYAYAGENLAKGFATSEGVMAGWLASPGHRANLLGQNYTEIGLAVVNGELAGDDTTLVVAFYGAPLPSGAVQTAGTDLTPIGTLAPSVQEYSAFHPLLVTQTAGWGQLMTLGLVGSLMPIYVMTHLSMWRHHLHHSARRMWRRRWLEFAALLALAATLALSGLGSVG